MKVLRSTKNISNQLFVPLAEAHQSNYNVIYCYDNFEPLEIEEVENLVKPRSYKELGILVDLLEKKLKDSYEKGKLCKLMTIENVSIVDGKMTVLVSSDYFKGRIGYEILLDGNYYIRICPWADGEFAIPFFEAYEEWLTELTGIKTVY